MKFFNFKKCLWCTFSSFFTIYLKIDQTDFLYAKYCSFSNLHSRNYRSPGFGLVDFYCVYKIMSMTTLIVKTKQELNEEQNVIN